MSEFQIQVVRIGPIEKHPNADTLSVTKIHGGYPVVIRTTDFREGDLAVYLPIDAVLPLSNPRFAFLKKPDSAKDSHRLKAAKLRGIFSMGLLIPSDPGWIEGQDVQDALGVTKYEPLVHLGFGDENETDPGHMPVYTDICGYRRYGEVLKPGEPVSITEKCHGANGRAWYQDGRLWMGSHTTIKKPCVTNLWWSIAEKYKLEERLKDHPGVGLYFEVYGWVQDLRYGAKRSGEVWMACFDAMDLKTRRYLDREEFVAFVDSIGLPRVPTLYEGPWDTSLLSLAEGQSTIPGADHIREGIVIKPMKERFDETIRRVILKHVGEGYLMRKSA